MPLRKLNAFSQYIFHIECVKLRPSRERCFSSVSTLNSTVPLDANSINEGRTYNMYQAINNALEIILDKNSNAVIFGEDVAFGGVFRCTTGLRERFGNSRIFNTPLSEQGIVGFGIGLANQGIIGIGEVQFADYVYPALDQLINEAAKMRYRSGSMTDCGNLTIRMPCGAVGHGALYHSQSPEAYLAHTSGLKIVVPRGPSQAKGLLLSCAEEPDPCIVLEPKALYRFISEKTPVTHYKIPIGKAEIVKKGDSITLLGWGNIVYKLLEAADLIKQQIEATCEVIDLMTILPWDIETVCESVKKTGRLVIAHEAPLTNGFGSEIAATIQERCFLHLTAPIQRVAGWDTPFPLAFEYFYLPDKWRCFNVIKRTLKF